MHFFLMQDREEAVRTHKDIVLGGSFSKYRRERRTQARAILSEIYLAPRVTEMVWRQKKYGIEPGLALDLTTTDDQGRPWDFNDSRQRQRAEQLLEDQQPLLLIGSPMCTAFPTWQRINNLIRSPVTVAAELRRAKQHLEFSVELYSEQTKAGRYFVHERPAYASSWQTDIMESMMKDKGVVKATCDQ